MHGRDEGRDASADRPQRCICTNGHGCPARGVSRFLRGGRAREEQWRGGLSLCPSPYRARVPKKKPARALAVSACPPPGTDEAQPITQDVDEAQPSTQDVVAQPDTSDAGVQAVPTAAASSCPPIPDECDAQPSTQHVDVAQPDTSEAGGQALPTAGDADAGDAID